MVVLILALVIVVGVVVAVVVGKVGTDSMAEPNRTTSFELPQHLGASELDGIRFDQSLRGYNMSQVDAVLDKLTEELRRSEAARHEHVGPLEPEHAPGSIVQFRTRRGDRGERQRADDE